MRNAQTIGIQKRLTCDEGALTGFSMRNRVRVQTRLPDVATFRFAPFRTIWPCSGRLRLPKNPPAAPPFGRCILPPPPPAGGDESPSVVRGAGGRAASLCSTCPPCLSVWSFRHRQEYAIAESSPVQTRYARLAAACAFALDPASTCT